jgi:hypothetical protein
MYSNFVTFGFGKVLRISRAVEFVPLALEELQSIITQSFPLVSSSGVLDFGVKFWMDVTAEASLSSSSSSSAAAACKYPSLSRHHAPSPRDFLRWGKRVHFQSSSPSVTGVSSALNHQYNRF